LQECRSDSRMHLSKAHTDSPKQNIRIVVVLAQNLHVLVRALALAEFPCKIPFGLIRVEMIPSGQAFEPGDTQANYIWPSFVIDPQSATWETSTNARHFVSARESASGNDAEKRLGELDACTWHHLMDSQTHSELNAFSRAPFSKESNCIQCILSYINTYLT
jgi:hypothetical protein